MHPPLPDAGARWALFLDFDGTLAEFASHPEIVEVHPGLVSLLERIGRRLDGALAVVSGRSISSLDRLLHPSRHPSAGRHGFERRVGEHVEQLADAAADGEMDAARAKLEAFAAERDGLLLEDKGSSLALHYRNAPELADLCRERIYTLAAQMPHHHVLEGKMVLELKLHTANKGTAIRTFCDEAPFKGRVPVFAGDDRTDEDGFEWVNVNGGVSIKIGAGETLARYRLDSVSALRDWLCSLADRLEDEEHR